MDAADLPDDIEALKAFALAALAKAANAEAAAANAKADAAHVLIESLKYEIARLRRETYGQTSERSARLLDQLEFQLDEMETDRGEDEAKADDAARKAGRPERTRKQPVKKPFPAHLPRERNVVTAPQHCPCCGGDKLSKIGEDVTETLESTPRKYKVIQTVREKFSCRSCEKISQPPAPFHVIARGHVGASLLAMLLYDKYALHQPLNRQSKEFARAGIDLPVSTLADHVGAAALALAPLYALIERHVFLGARVHGDDSVLQQRTEGRIKMI
jgi:transposase